jgi:hypothetical protein
MYGGLGGGGPVVGLTSVAAGVAVLPNTGDNKVFIAVSIFSIVVGALILVSTAARFIAKKAFKA